MVNGNIFDAIRRNQELERQKRVANRESFVDPAIQQVRAKGAIEALQLNKPVNTRSQIAKPISIKNQVGRTNISPQAKNALDLQRAFPSAVSSVIDRGSFRELEITKSTGERQNIVGSEALETRLRNNIQGTGSTIRRKGLFDSIFSFINGLRF